MKIIQQLLELQGVELGARASSPAARREGELLRREVPEPILGHYNRLVSRGKKAVAVVRRGVCTGCQMRLPSGIYAKLLRDDDICVCDNCARYLMLAPEEDATAAPITPLVPKRTARRRVAVAVAAAEPVAA
jgi:predicted  nucleic acid-binding Zn-ribbon protein